MKRCCEIFMVSTTLNLYSHDFMNPVQLKQKNSMVQSSKKE